MDVDQLVVLHGWGGNPSRWRPLVNRLKKSANVFLPGLPRDQVRRTADFADWLGAKTKKFPPFNLIGHSFGGQIAIDFTARYPRRVKKLILINSAGIRRTGLKARLLRPLAQRLKGLPPGLKAWGYRLIGASDYFRAGPVMKETMKLILTEDQQGNMAKITAPTLLIWGRQDRYTPLRDGRLIHRLINNSLMQIYPGGHGLPFTHARILAEKILWFTGSK